MRVLIGRVHALWPGYFDSLNLNPSLKCLECDAARAGLRPSCRDRAHVELRTSSSWLELYALSTFWLTSGTFWSSSHCHISKRKGKRRKSTKNMVTKARSKQSGKKDNGAGRVIKNGSDKKYYSVIKKSKIVVTRINLLLIPSRQNDGFRGYRVFFSVKSDAARVWQVRGILNLWKGLWDSGVGACFGRNSHATCQYRVRYRNFGDRAQSDFLSVEGRAKIISGVQARIAGQE